MKKLKFLKMFLLTTIVIGIFNIFNVVAMERKNNQKTQLNNNDNYKIIDTINISNPFEETKSLKINILELQNKNLEDNANFLFLEADGIKSRRYNYY